MTKQQRPAGIKQLEQSHGIGVGDSVTLGRGSMIGTVIDIRASRRWTNGGVPIARVVWKTGATGRHTIAKLNKQNRKANR